MPGGWDGRLCRQADRCRCSAERCGTRMRQLLEGSTESAARPLSNLINIDRLACSQFAANLKRVEAATRSPSGGRQDATVRASAAQLSTRLGGAIAFLLVARDKRTKSLRHGQAARQTSHLVRRWLVLFEFSSAGVR